MLRLSSRPSISTMAHRAPQARPSQTTTQVNGEARLSVFSEVTIVPSTPNSPRLLRIPRQ